MTKQYLIPILAAALMTVPLLLDQDADAQTTYTPQNYADLPAFTSERPPNAGNCLRSQAEVDETKLPEFTVQSRTVRTQGPVCMNFVNTYDAFALIYKLGNGSQPHELAHRIDSEAASIRQTINLDDDGFGLGMYRIFYFLTDDMTNYLTGEADVTHSVATATMTIAPPPR